MHSKPQKEQWLYDQLGELQIEAYYPCLRVKYGRSCSYRSKPYFPRYLFVNVDLTLTGISMLQWIPGSLGLVAFGGEPACVPDGLLQRIQNRVDEINGAEDQLFDILKPGDEVVIRSGPFAGYDAIFCTRLRDSERVQILLKVLQEHVIRVDLQVSQIRARKQSRTLS
jgi:transcriptional antiterminator RfaH